MTGSKKVTLKDVAEMAGVSPATVSLVVQGKGNLKDETRESVLRTIEETGYSRKAPSTRKVQGAQFALVVDDIANPYFHALYEGLDKVLADAGACTSILSTHDSIARQRQLLHDLWESGIAGVVLVPATGTTYLDLQEFENRRRPLLMAVRRIGQSPFDYVGANPMVGMQLATEHLAALGHEKIGFIGGYQKNFAYSERYAGFASSLMSHGLELDPTLIRNGGSTRAFGYSAARDVLAAKNHPTALIGYNDLVAIGIMDAVVASGLRVGKDIAVIGYDDIPEAALQPVPLTSVATPAEKLGEMVGQALQSWSLDRSSGSPLDITYPPRLIVRESCGASIETENRS
ncbi:MULTISPECIES: LacI family DNA-binding transcriptional regulator [Nioella]|jgi:LacI family transcriptional regulator|uniref:LacI family DNA-binding transcriptional regulator n=1 Tax=Nioella TaxID=1775424 RepID=UPI000FD719A9|nr:substrate-binding domain-containing protein [Nioella ostreopsis]